MTQKKEMKLAAVILAVSTVALLIACVVVTVIWLAGRKETCDITPEEESAQLANFEKNFESLVISDEFSRKMLYSCPDRLVEYMHINDVYYGTNLCDGIKEERLKKQLANNPGMVANYAERYFNYLDEKYN